MQKLRIEAIVLSLLFSLLCQFILQHYLASALVGVVFAFFLFASILPNYLVINKEEKKLDDINQWISQLLVQLGSTPTLFEALEQVSAYFPIEVQHLFTEDSDQETRLGTLSSYYSNRKFTAFLDALRVYDRVGGDYLNLTDVLVMDLLYSRYWFQKLKLVKKQKILLLLSLWGLSLVVVIYLRFGLSAYYLLLLTQHLFWIVVLFLLGFIASITLAFRQYASDLEEEHHEEERN